MGLICSKQPDSRIGSALFEWVSRLQLLPEFLKTSYEDIAVSKNKKQRQVACGCCLFMRTISGFDLLQAT
jgi:hypothetical protein